MLRGEDWCSLFVMVHLAFESGKYVLLNLKLHTARVACLLRLSYLILLGFNVRFALCRGVVDLDRGSWIATLGLSTPGS